MIEKGSFIIKLPLSIFAARGRGDKAPEMVR